MLDMTAFIWYDSNPGIYGNPYNSNDVWYYMQARWKDGSYMKNDGLRGQSGIGPRTTLAFTGDPEAGRGWLDSNESDRRFLMTTGPFPMPAWEDENRNGLADFGEPGVQDIVAGMMVARGTSNVNSVTQLKVVDALAQMLYDLNFFIPRPPSLPVITVTELPNEIILTWDDRSEWIDQGAGTMPTPYESIDPIITDALGDTVIMDNVVKVVDDDTYNFLGYAAYQYSDAAGADPRLLQSWTVPEAVNPVPYDGQRFIRITDNRHAKVGNVGDPLYNGKAYCFGVKAIAYCEFGGPPYFETDPTIVTATPKYTPGKRYNTAYHDTLDIVVHENLVDPRSDATVDVRVIDRDAITGHDYTVWFNSQQYYRDVDGIWRPALANTRLLNKSSDIYGSTLTVAATVPEPGSPAVVRLEFLLNLVSPNNAWADGVEITFPDGINIVQADTFDGMGGPGDGTPTINGQTITYGGNYLSEWGPYVGGQTFNVWVDMFTPPIDIYFTIWDDGWEPGATGIVDAVGVATVTEISYATQIRDHWNVRDNVTGFDVVENHTDVYPGVDGSAAPIADGLQVIIDGSWAAPADFFPAGDPPITGTGIYNVSSYGNEHWADDALASTFWGVGTEDLAMLTQDYECRFTGVYVDTTADVIEIDPATGSVGTFIGSRNYAVGDHPMNPNPGVGDYFGLQIPMEIWNVTTGEQVTYCIYDRMQAATAVPFYAFNPADRMYPMIHNAPYTGAVIDPDGADAEIYNTWMQVWWTCDWVIGDVVYFNYANPIINGSDTYDFTTAGLEPVITEETKESDLNEIRVVPNPYYGYHSGEMHFYDKWVQFTYLPQTCTIRIFDLAGTLVKKFEKDDDSTFLRWNLANELNIYVASGVYVYHVDVSGTGEKIGKFVLFMHY